MEKNKTLETKVTDQDVDFYKHADYSNYLKWYKQGHQDFLESNGLSFQEMQENYGVKTFVRHADVEYLGQLFEGNNISINTSVDKIGTTSMRYNQLITCEEKVVSKAKITVVFTDKYNKPTKVPDEIRQLLS
ncbi:MAG: acyl-CoA thioesterase [Nanoarchaeota archaeon]|nr:acyl-CoA thioesterase [Nanoarchaeota archaeon]MBU4455882.1 acyl-CoA thioesterase [Nanoarchaeota archaeon]MCG2719748.1 acyl-CoA thioesterase [Nanoarchaeota archaeon]